MHQFLYTEFFLYCKNVTLWKNLVLRCIANAKQVLYKRRQLLRKIWAPVYKIDGTRRQTYLYCELDVLFIRKQTVFRNEIKFTPNFAERETSCFASIYVTSLTKYFSQYAFFVPDAYKSSLVMSYFNAIHS